jgi:hypothetical protein
MLRTLFLATFAAATVAAQQPATGAVLVLYQPKPGLDRDFELGDQRHLEWHRSVNDRWLWPGWTIADGERRGFFLDATFFHPWTDFDHPLRPDEDEANWAINVAPYADVRSVMRYDVIPTLTTLSAAQLSAPYMTLAFITIHPGMETKFEVAVSAALHLARVPIMVMRPITGANEYIMMIPAQDIAAFPTNAAQIESAMQSVAPFVERTRTETWRYRPELSYVPR